MYKGGRSWHPCRTLAVVLLVCVHAASAKEPARQFDIPAAEASRGLSLFARQARVPLFYLSDAVRKKRTHAVHGTYSVCKALGILLADTGIAGSINGRGVITITLVKSAAPRAVTHVARAVQQHGSRSTESLPEIMVTAQFHSEPLQRTPLAMTVLSGAQLVADGFNDITGLGDVAPSVNLTTTGAYGGKTLAAYVRGVGASDYNFGVEPGVAFYLDGMYLGPSYGTMLLLDMGDLARIEAVRGPQGTLSGKNAIGGAVYLVSQAPTGDDSGYAQVEVGSLSLVRIRAAYDASLIDGKLLARVSGYSSHRDGYVTLLNFACVNPTEVGNSSAPYALKNDSPGQSCARGDLGDEDVRAGRIRLRWLPSDSLDIDLSVDYVDDESNGAADVLIGMNPAGFAEFNATTAIPYYGVPYDTRFLPPNHFSSYATFSDPQFGLGFPPVDTLLTRDAILTTEWQLRPNLSLTAISGYRAYSGRWSYDSDSSPLATDSVYDKQSHQQVSQELRLSGTSLAGRLSWTVGGFYYHGRERDVAEIVAALYNLYIDTDSRPYNSNYAEYLHSELKLTRPLTLVAGVRETHEDETYLYVEQDIPGTPSDAFPGGFYYPARTDYSHFDYRIGPEYQFTPTFMAYAQVSTGFRGGGFNPRPASPAQAISYGPERLTSYETGTRNEFLEHRLRLDNTAYFGRYADVQLTARLPDVGNGFPDTVIANAGSANIYGFESELQADIASWLTFDASGSYTHFRYTNLGPAVGLTDGPTLHTDQIYTPTWKLSIGQRIALPWLRRYGRLLLESEYSWRSLQYADAANSPQMAIPAYGLLNLRLSLAMKRGWTVSMSGTNVTNTFYYSAKNFISGDYQWKGLPGLPAEWELTVRRAF